MLAFTFIMKFMFRISIPFISINNGFQNFNSMRDMYTCHTYTFQEIEIIKQIADQWLGFRIW